MRRLSRQYLERIAARVVAAYRKLPQVAEEGIHGIDPERLLHEVLGLNVEYHHIARDGSILGLTSNCEIDLELWGGGEPYFVALDGKTVLVEKRLKEQPEQLGRCHFTLLHEGGHQILKMLFPKDYGVPGASGRIHFSRAQWAQHEAITDWEEWQANVLASAILLPPDLILRTALQHGLQMPIRLLNKVVDLRTYDAFCAVAQRLGCSKRALAIRMKGLRLLEREYLEDPYAIMRVEMSEEEYERFGA